MPENMFNVYASNRHNGRHLGYGDLWTMKKMFGVSTGTWEKQPDWSSKQYSQLPICARKIANTWTILSIEANNPSVSNR